MAFDGGVSGFSEYTALGATQAASISARGVSSAAASQLQDVQSGGPANLVNLFAALFPQVVPALLRPAPPEGVGQSLDISG